MVEEGEVNEGGDGGNDRQEGNAAEAVAGNALSSNPFAGSIFSVGSDGSRPTLNWFLGVFIPVCLAMFSSLLFLRVGYIVANAGLVVSFGALAMAYATLIFTVYSLSTLATAGGKVGAGGVYYMVSRCLGAELGATVGIVFYVANVVGSALFAVGCVEGIASGFGSGGSVVDLGFPDDQNGWARYE